MRGFAKLRRDERGLALTEFALSLPVLVAVGLYGIETANYVIANLRVSQIANLVADNAGRGGSDPSAPIDEVDINDIMLGAKKAGEGIAFSTNGRIILSDLEQSTTNTARQWIRWQRCSGAKNITSSYGTPNTEATTTMTAMGPTGNQIASQPSTAVMFVEVVYDYQPLISASLLGVSTIRFTRAYNVRARSSYAVTNGSNLATAKTSSCSIYSA